ncbi:hypothetical protein [Streptomyces olivaceus]|uniref:hypothetical protein n=1 Tax=Streptomyces olivaceus TaxID=47716 RepID=UPI001CCF271A|nr:hypothetical protein [Streptomyces olivaceus]
MTQSGQGEEPSPRQAREGIVLPSDGGEPLLPGLAGQPVAPQAGGPVPASAPPGGQAWDRPWGPEQQSPDSGQGWPAPPGAQSWGASGTAQPSSPPPVEAATQTWPPMPGGQAEAPGALPSQSGPGPLPPEGTQSPAYGTPAGTYGGQPPYQQHEQQHQQQQHEQQQAYQQQQPYQQHGQQQHHEPYQQHQQNQGHYQQQAQHYGGQGAASLPPADEGATQLIPPVPIPADEGATQYIPPVGPGALPPEQPAQAHAESTRFLGRQPQYPAQPAPSAPPPPAAHSDAEATQYIAPVPGGPAGGPYGAASGGDEGRQPPAEFDNLFRSAPGADGAASSTQQLPQFDQPQQYQPPGPAGYAPQGPGGPGGGKRRGNGGGGRGGRTGSRMPLFAAVGVGIAVVGVGAGAMMAGGGDDGDKGANQTVSATADASESASASASAPPDPVREQAVELDKLLAESGTGRTTVINAVGDVKSCENLPEAAEDLREAAKQRNGLVESLSKLSVDKLPQHTELTTALTKAWKASASADDHYAAWADQAAGKKGCKKGQARTTKETQAGNRESGTASKEKTKAAGLWNAIAKKYGLTERQPTQL